MPFSKVISRKDLISNPPTPRLHSDLIRTPQGPKQKQHRTMSWVGQVVRGTRTVMVGGGLQRPSLSLCGCNLSNSPWPVTKRTPSFVQSRGAKQSTKKTATELPTSGETPPVSEVAKRLLRKKRVRTTTTFSDRSNYVWTPEVDAKIVNLRLEGNSWAEIGAAVGVDQAACHSRYMRVLDPSHRLEWTPEKMEKLNALVFEGKPWSRIAAELLTTQVVCREKWASMHQDMASHARKGTSLVASLAAPNPSRNSRLLLGVAEVGLVSGKRRRWCDHIDSLLLHLHGRGLNWKQVGKVLGTSPLNCYSRYHYRIKGQLDEGWTPMELNLDNTPYYLLPDRPLQALVARAASTAEGSDTSSNATLTPCKPRGPLGLVGEDYLYDIEPDESKLQRNWSKEEDNTILEGRKAGFSFKVIGDDLRIDPVLCHYRYVTELSEASKKDKWTPRLEERLLFYIQQGMSWPSIGEEFGIHPILCQQKYRQLKNPQSSTGENTNRQQQSTDDNGAASSRQGAATSVDGHQERLDDDDDSADGFDEDYNGRDMEEEEEQEGEYTGDDTMDDQLLTTGSEDGEEILDDDTEERSTSSQDIGDSIRYRQDDYHLQRDLHTRWTLDDETKLIRHVINNGTQSWQDISDKLAGKFTAEECRTLWKFLDMPVRPTNLRSNKKWDAYRESQFWRLWLENGSDFNMISRKLSENDSAGQRSEGSLSGGLDGGRDGQGDDSTGLDEFTPEECEALFKQQISSQSPPLDEDDANFNRDCVRLALSKSKVPKFHWDRERSVKLQKLVRLRLRTRGFHVDWVNWKWVARHVGGGATIQGCSVHWRLLRSKEQDNWTNEELLLLEQGIREVGSCFDKNESMTSGAASGPSRSVFRAVQRHYLPHRRMVDLELKYFLMSEKATQVTVDEYMTLQEAVEKYGEGHWDKVVEHMREHLPASSESGSAVRWTKAPARRVWEASYKAKLMHMPWTTTEDEDLLYTVKKIGHKDWVAVSRFFPDKSAWVCRLRWCQLTDDQRTGPKEEQNP